MSAGEGNRTAEAEVVVFWWDLDGFGPCTSLHVHGTDFCLASSCLFDLMIVSLLEDEQHGTATLP